MSQSLSKIYIHLIFHIKTTSPTIREEDMECVHGYIGGVVNITGCKVIMVGGIGDHVHILFLLSNTVPLSKVVEDVKRNSSRWIKTLHPRYQFFEWQNGYGAFSVSQSVVPSTLRYIGNQPEHHKKISFADEFRNFLKLYEVDYNDQYVLRD